MVPADTTDYLVALLVCVPGVRTIKFLRRVLAKAAIRIATGVLQLDKVFSLPV